MWQGRRDLRVEARKAKERMVAEVAHIQAEECAKGEASRKEREEREEERKAQVAREQAKERARLRRQRAREEAGRKEWMEKEAADGEEAEEAERPAIAAREAAVRQAAEKAKRKLSGGPMQHERQWRWAGRRAEFSCLWVIAAAMISKYSCYDCCIRN